MAAVASFAEGRYYLAAIRNPRSSGNARVKTTLAPDDQPIFAG